MPTFSALLPMLLSSAPPLVQADPQCTEPPRAPLVAIAVQPGLGTRLDGRENGLVGALHGEYRPLQWLAVRAGFEMSPSGQALDVVGVKVSPNTIWRPFFAASLSANFLHETTGARFGTALSGGLDVSLGRGFFLEAEARVRLTADNTPRASLSVGAGFEFF
jgi:hypothetical protein